ncbi:MAG: efflux RND transporter periplasmic adaptor subunit [Panacagrimonas sp.]
MSTRRSVFRWLVLVIVLAGGAAAWICLRVPPAPDAAYITDVVTRGELTETVSANGTLNPVTLVSIGTQVSGTALTVSADFNDSVEKGQVLVELDPAAYEAKVRQTRASMESAQASLELARANATRAQDLFDKGYIAQQQLDEAAQVLKSAAAQVENARAQVEDAEVDLRNSVIRSPIAGVVVARTVDVGQTVAASFQTPELFRIAGDLKKMLIHTTFAEADIGRIQPGQPARFTVDAFPDRSFRGAVRQVRLNPTTTQNVVTYDVVVDVDNDDLSLLPGMTAYVNVVLSRAGNSLRVPNAALRYRPKLEAPDAGQTATRAAEAAPTVGAAPQRGARGANAGGRRGAVREPTVYVVRAQQIVPVKLRTGATDGRNTAVESAELQEGDIVIVGDRVSPSSPQQSPQQMRMRMF